MLKENNTEEPTSEEELLPPWPASAPQPFTPRDGIALFFERFGFLIAAGITLAVLGYIFYNYQLLLSQPDVGIRQGVGVALGDSSSVVITINSEPEGARVLINNVAVGITPLRDYELPDGTYRISLQKSEFALLDTLVTVAGLPLTLNLSLHGESEDDIGDSSESLDKEEPTEEQAQREEPEQQTLSREPTEEQKTQEARPISNATQQEGASSASNTDQRSRSEEEAKPIPEPAKGRLQVTSQPSGASVTLSNQTIGKTPLVISDAAVGRREIAVRLDGYEPFSSTVTIVADETESINVQLKQSLGTLKILAKPWGAIYIDGKLHKDESNVWYTVKVPVGKHRVRVEHPALGKYDKVVDVPATGEQVIEVDFNQGGGP